MKSRREGRDTRHREKCVNTRESISYPFLLMDIDFPVKAKSVSVLVKLQNHIIVVKAEIPSA